ncbi:hypothetical protein [Mesorhizobium sp. B2-3-2]|uniref:hypothetical protein n=1 Tax=Mesorhizobium sp. B2-3-2 TaxID=2589961 RepID=UPI00112A4FEE|nr:hypothetical protein [Mesorhizobium sp. B2-3-2]TPM43326.1 hypothetical protein FJ964_21675 [Mesorhizobium sp. B2-3-2]
MRGSGGGRPGLRDIGKLALEIKMRAAKRLILGITVFCAILPTEVFAAYKCMNPAICRAVCGSETCGKIAARDPDMKALDLSKGAAGQIAASSSGSSSGTSSRKTYTCSNPAICIAVCGKKTCP